MQGETLRRFQNGGQFRLLAGVIPVIHLHVLQLFRLFLLRFRVQHAAHQRKQLQFVENGLQDIPVDVLSFQFSNGNLRRHFGADGHQVARHPDGRLAVQQVLPLLSFQFVDMSVNPVDVTVFVH